MVSASGEKMEKCKVGDEANLNQDRFTKQNGSYPRRSPFTACVQTRHPPRRVHDKCRLRTYRRTALPFPGTGQERDLQDQIRFRGMADRRHSRQEIPASGQTGRGKHFPALRYLPRRCRLCTLPFRIPAAHGHLQDPLISPLT